MGQYSASEECAQVDSECSDVWLVIYEQCMESSDFGTLGGLDPQDECFDEADYVYDECMYAAGC